MATDTNAEVVETEARPTDRSAEVVETEAPPTDGNIEVLETETPPADKVAEVAETETRPDLLWDDRIDCVVELTFAQTTKNGGSSRVALSCSSSVSAMPPLDRGWGTQSSTRYRPRRALWVRRCSTVFICCVTPYGFGFSQFFLFN